MTEPGGPAGRLLHRLVDDAGLFPPTALSMPDAIRRHRDDIAAAEPMLTQRFLCPASRIEELRQHLDDSDRFALGLILDSGTDESAGACATVSADPRLSLALLEIPLRVFADAGPGAAAGEGRTAEAEGSAPGGTVEARALHRALQAVATVPTTVPAHLEPSAPSRVDALLDAIGPAAGRGVDGGQRTLGAKLRCGGVRAELFPGPAETAHFVMACVAAGVPFKATAGLHRAVRHTDPSTGFLHHGFLNLLLATATAVADGSEQDVRRVLETGDADGLQRVAARTDAATAAATRRLFVGYGSCSTRTPVREAHAIVTADRERTGQAGKDRPE